MPKIKLTKSELKHQRDSLKQFARYLPTLQLKKQQLQLEMRKCQAKLSEIEEVEHKLREGLSHWISLFGPDKTVTHLKSLIALDRIDTGRLNIAGVEVPVFDGVHFKITDYNLFIEDLWIDDAIEIIKQLIEVKIEHHIVEEQYRLIGHELRVTTQRVNLFEKVKIPECKENIRTIQIYLGDMDTAAVGRSKIAKKKAQEVAA